MNLDFYQVLLFRYHLFNILVSRSRLFQILLATDGMNDAKVVKPFLLRFKIKRVHSLSATHGSSGSMRAAHE